MMNEDDDDDEDDSGTNLFCMIRNWWAKSLSLDNCSFIWTLNKGNDGYEVMIIMIMMMTIMMMMMMMMMLPSIKMLIDTIEVFI